MLKCNINQDARKIIWYMRDLTPERQMTIQEGNAIPVDREFQLGVFLVHGIGTQRSGDTLVRWGDVLLKTIECATLKKVLATVESAGPRYGPGKGPLEAAVLLDRTEQRWLLSEGWWADAFPAPSYRELVSWSVRALPWSIASHIAERYWGASSGHWDRARIVALASALGQLLVALALAPLSIGLLGLALLLGLLPVPKIRTAILAAQSTLTATVGDSFAFVESPLRAALIRTCILDGLKRVKQRCAHTVIVAHSQGAAVVLDALGGMIFEQDEETEARAASGVVPDALVTFGAGTNQLASQKVLSAGLPTTFGTNPVLGAVGALLGAVGILLWLYLSVQLQQTTLKDILWALLLLLLHIGLVSTVMWALFTLLDRTHADDRVSTIAGGTFGFLIVAGLLLLIWYGGLAHLPLFPLSMLFVALLSIAGSMRVILSDKMNAIVTAPVRKPPGLARWVDLYASADPVPHGPTRTKDAHESIPIWNLGSMAADHTAYWGNRDGFVLRVVKVCAETAQSPWSGALPRAPRSVDERAAWRVGFLRMARRSTGVTWLVLGAFLWTRYEASIPLTFDMPGWVPAAPVRLVLLAAFIASAMWATSGVLRWLWNWWVHAEQEAVLAHNQPGGKSQEWYPHIAVSLMGDGGVDADRRDVLPDENQFVG